MRHFLLGLFIQYSLVSFCQENDNLDEIFDDGTKTSNIQIGTGITPTTGGTLNLTFDYKYLSFLELHVGAGIMPFGYHVDLSNLIFSSGEAIDDNIGFGVYHKIGNRVKVMEEVKVFRNVYSCIEWERWQFNAEKYFSVRRNKVNFAFGYKRPLKGRFFLDMNIGPFIGQERVVAKGLDIPQDWSGEVRGKTRNASHSNMNASETIAGFDIYVGLTYSL